MLAALNQIYAPDSRFTDLLVQKHNNTNRWELFLEEQGKGHVALTHTGSGLRTIILVLALTELVPHIEKKKIGEYVYCLEELENNLHPALQRRLLLFLKDVAARERCVFFLTTHSSVAINLFSRDEAAQILHVTHDGQDSVVRSVETFVDSGNVLDDLDVRASDLLQSNGVVWVEGPSDRVYVNRWIDLCSGGKLVEGTHFMCVPYGGRLLAGLSAETPEARHNRIKIFNVNRNAAVVIDSDRVAERKQINSTKKRIRDEVKATGGMAWVTMGKEIENYVPVRALEALLERSGLQQVGQFDDFADYLNGIEDSRGDWFERNKVAFAEHASEHMTWENSCQLLDLGRKITELARHICRWNSMDPGFLRSTRQPRSTPTSLLIETN